MFPKKFGTIDFVMISAELIDYLEPEQKYDCKQIEGKFNTVNWFRKIISINVRNKDWGLEKYTKLNTIFVQ